MIVDTLKNAPKYFCHGGLLEKALRYLVATDFTALEPGTYEVDSAGVIAKVRVFPEGGNDIAGCVWEGHHACMDIHYVVEGVERFGYANIGQMKEVAYNPDNDTADFEGEGTVFSLYPGMFAAVDLDDIHLPAVKDCELPLLKKVVLKVPV